MRPLMSRVQVFFFFSIYLELKSDLFPKQRFRLRVSGLRSVLRVIGLVDYSGHPQPPQRTGHGCTVGVNRDPPVWPSTQGRMVEVPERQPYVRWTTTYHDYEEMRNMDFSPHTPPRAARDYDLVDFGITSTSRHSTISSTSSFVGFSLVLVITWRDSALHCTESLSRFNSFRNLRLPLMAIGT